RDEVRPRRRCRYGLLGRGVRHRTRRGGQPRGDFDREPVAPPVLSIHLLTDPEGKLLFAGRIHDARSGIVNRGPHARSHLGVRGDVLDPLRFESVLGDEIKVPIDGHEPDLYLARLSGLATGGRKIEVLRFVDRRGHRSAKDTATSAYVVCGTTI